MTSTVLILGAAGRIGQVLASASVSYTRLTLPTKRIV